jgi:hypothetical protein
MSIVSLFCMPYPETVQGPDLDVMGDEPKRRAGRPGPYERWEAAPQIVEYCMLCGAREGHEYCATMPLFCVPYPEMVQGSD